MNDTQLMTLAREYGTPLYLFEQTALRDRVALLRECLPARAELCLAIKANPFALPIIRPYVHRLEVCSPGELNICEACGTAPEEIVLSGVYKDEAMVRHALSLGDIHRYTVESLAQFEAAAPPCPEVRPSLAGVAATYLRKPVRDGCRRYPRSCGCCP